MAPNYETNSSMEKEWVLTYEGWTYRIPERMRPGLIRYRDKGVIPGDFLQAIICNNLVRAAGRADGENLGNLPAYANWLYNHLPLVAYGSEESMERWNEEGGSEGILKERKENAHLFEVPKPETP